MEGYRTVNPRSSSYVGVRTSPPPPKFKLYNSEVTRVVMARTVNALWTQNPS